MENDDTEKVENHEAHTGHKCQKGYQDHGGYEGYKDGNHHAYMVTDSRKRFWMTLSITVLILILSPLIQVGHENRAVYAIPLAAVLIMATGFFYPLPWERY